MKMKVVTVKLPEHLLKELDLFAMNNWMSRSDVVREAIESYLNGNCLTKTPGNPLRLKSSESQVF
ncbi:hypothetical protein AVU39_gp50 [Sulfolobus monocaudavirus SMV2]|uniref:hypothetical protein n=1 Tax=Sulfolobus monocaudavirus SMV2 TaxID=1580591 RepID=UPI0006D2E745|nr:hypothetical protein AVU39_gp50 [Sulfolobus monocaudavirus SMV2]AIZ11384.1 hypothetical protein [Sulfolobus monocaudavirus SMV2]